MPLVMQNFIRTSVRSPVAVEDTTLQLAAGGGVFFDIPAGSYCYLTVNDATKAEVMKYVSAGPVVDDVITVIRAQDNTTAQAFAAGTCVSEAWNVAQVRDFTQQLIDATPTPNNTMVVNVDPVLAPAVNIHYAININTGQLWYYATVDADGVPVVPHWVAIVSNGVQVLTSAPVSAPPGGITWTINSASNALYFYTGSAWLLIAGGGSGGLLEAHGWQYYNSPTGFDLSPDTYAFAELAASPNDLPFDIFTSYKSNPAAVNIILRPTTGGNAFQVVFFANCIMQMDATVIGTATTPGSALEAYLELTHTHTPGVGLVGAFGTSLNRPAASSQTTVFMNVSTGPITISAGDVWDANLTVIGPSNLTLTQATLTASMLVLL